MGRLTYKPVNWELVKNLGKCDATKKFIFSHLNEIIPSRSNLGESRTREEVFLSKNLFLLPCRKARSESRDDVRGSFQL